jgi:hypothetical protein
MCVSESHWILENDSQTHLWKIVTLSSPTIPQKDTFMLRGAQTTLVSSYSDPERRE